MPSAWSFAIVLRSRVKSFPRNCASRSLKIFGASEKSLFDSRNLGVVSHELSVEIRLSPYL